MLCFLQVLDLVRIGIRVSKNLETEPDPNFTTLILFIHFPVPTYYVVCSVPTLFLAVNENLLELKFLQTFDIKTAAKHLLGGRGGALLGQHLIIYR